jgi:hypothetical protein
MWCGGFNPSHTEWNEVRQKVQAAVQKVKASQADIFRSKCPVLPALLVPFIDVSEVRFDMAWFSAAQNVLGRPCLRSEDFEMFERLKVREYRHSRLLLSRGADEEYLPEFVRGSFQPRDAFQPRDSIQPRERASNSIATMRRMRLRRIPMLLEDELIFPEGPFLDGRQERIGI